MSDVMFFGVLEMPMDMAMADPVSRLQFYERAQEAVARIRRVEAELAALQAPAIPAGWPKYTMAMGRSAERYLYQTNRFAHAMPDKFHWEECFNAMLAAAPTPAPGDGWLPIESAPKDGSWIFVGNESGAWIAAYEPIYTSGYRPKNPWASKMLNHDGLRQIQRGPACRQSGNHSPHRQKRTRSHERHSSQFAYHQGVSRHR